MTSVSIDGVEYVPEQSVSDSASINMWDGGIITAHTCFNTLVLKRNDGESMLEINNSGTAYVWNPQDWGRLNIKGDINTCTRDTVKAIAKQIGLYVSDTAQTDTTSKDSIKSGIVRIEKDVDGWLLIYIDESGYVGSIKDNGEPTGQLKNWFRGLLAKEKTEQPKLEKKDVAKPSSPKTRIVYAKPNLNRDGYCNEKYAARFRVGVPLTVEAHNGNWIIRGYDEVSERNDSWQFNTKQLDNYFTSDAPKTPLKNWDDARIGDVYEALEQYTDCNGYGWCKGSHFTVKERRDGCSIWMTYQTCGYKHPSNPPFNDVTVLSDSEAKHFAKVL
jgi:hypothetical protein